MRKQHPNIVPGPEAYGIIQPERATLASVPAPDTFGVRFQPEEGRATPVQVAPRLGWTAGKVEAFDRETAPPLVTSEEVAAARSAVDASVVADAVRGVAPLSEVMAVIAAREACLAEALQHRHHARELAASFADTGAVGADLLADDHLRKAVELEAKAELLFPERAGQCPTISRAGFRLTEPLAEVMLRTAKSAAWRSFLAYGGRAQNPAIDPEDSASAAVAAVVEAYGKGKILGIGHLLGSVYLRARYGCASAIRATWNPKRWATGLKADGLMIPAPLYASRSEEARNRTRKVIRARRLEVQHEAAECLSAAASALIRKEPISGGRMGRPQSVKGSARFLLALKAGESVEAASARAGWSRRKAYRVVQSLRAAALANGAAGVLKPR